MNKDKPIAYKRFAVSFILCAVPLALCAINQGTYLIVDLSTSDEDSIAQERVANIHLDPAIFIEVVKDEPATKRELMISLFDDTTEVKNESLDFDFGSGSENQQFFDESLIDPAVMENSEMPDLEFADTATLFADEDQDLILNTAMELETVDEVPSTVEFDSTVLPFFPGVEKEEPVSDTVLDPAAFGW
jgi:hypothetical protein